MLQNSRSLLLLVSLLILPLISSSARLGGWQPIKDLNDHHVTEIAEFAVAEYNKKSKTSLKLDSVLKGETQVVAGINYRLDLAVKDGVKTVKYQAVVWEKAWEHFESLVSFTPINQPNHH